MEMTQSATQHVNPSELHRKLTLALSYIACASSLIHIHKIQFPENCLQLTQGSLVRALRNNDDRGIQKGDIIPLFYDGECITTCPAFASPSAKRSGGWPVEQLIAEIIGEPAKSKKQWELVSMRELFTPEELTVIDHKMLKAEVLQLARLSQFESCR